MLSSEALGFSQTAFDTRATFCEQLLQALRRAQREVWMADANFTAWPLGAPDFVEALHHFFHASGANRLYLLTLDAERIAPAAPRFMAVLRTFSSAAHCRVVPAHGAARFGEACSMLIADRSFVVRRFHRDNPRGIAELDPGGVRVWIDQFELLWGEATPCLAGTSLGLP